MQYAWIYKKKEGENPKGRIMLKILSRIDIEILEINVKRIKEIKNKVIRLFFRSLIFLRSKPIY